MAVSDPAAMAQQIARYANDPQQARAAGAAGRARVEQHFSLQAMSGRYQGLYDQLLSVNAGKADRKALIHP